MIKERYELAKERLIGIGREELVAMPYADYFKNVAEFLCLICKTYEEIRDDVYFVRTEEELADANEKLYADVLPEQYGSSYANPAVAEKLLGTEYGQILSFVYTQMRSLIPAAYEQKLFEIVIHLELFLEIYASFAYAYQDTEKQPDVKLIEETIYFFVHDYAEDMTLQRVKEKVDPAEDFAYRIITQENLSDTKYLYKYGEYITPNQVKTAEYLAGVSEEQLRLMADTYTEGYRIGFVKGNKDLSKKKVVQIVYPIGFERMIKLAIDNFEKMGLQPAIMRTPHSIFTKRGTSLGGFYSESPNKQYEYDHREDEALFLDKKMANRRLEVQKEAYETYKTLSSYHAGPAWVEVFGEKPFTPQICPQACKLSRKQQELSTWYYGQLGQLINEYIPGEERSFTIIAFPIPEIGSKYEQIMTETIKLNTLDYETYENIQQTIIDALDTCDYVKVEGIGDNKTDLKVMLTKIKTPETQTKFENCVADVNIPVGEVFTSPMLSGTEGVLHVSKVYLREFEYCNLMLTFKDGKITNYSCSNFDTEEEGQKLIAENVLYHHETLPMGEFAIGTNTTAYRMGQKFGIEDRLPILIAEKTGPHFAVGDTCYSHAEDVAVYNADGKEIIARDNEISLLRKTDPDKAYFQCHTDITIPYDELGALYGMTLEGARIEIIRDGRVVLPGTEELNRALDE